MSAVNNILSASFRHVWDSREDQVNKLHLRVDTVPTPNDQMSHLDDIGEFLGQAYAEIEGQISNLVDPVDVTVYNVTQDVPYGQGNNFSGYVGGTGTGDSLPPIVTCLLLLYTGVKRVTGKVYLPTFVEACQANSIWGSGTITAVETFASFFMGSFAGGHGGEYTPVVYSVTHGQGYPVIGYRVQPVTAKMSSRKPGKGS